MTTSVLPRDYAARSRFYPHVLAGNPAFALALPLYLVSGAAAVLTLVAFVLALLRFSASSRQRPEPGATPATQRTGQ